MKFDKNQKSPWPLWRRVQIGFGITFVAPTLSLSLREWLFDPFCSLTLPGQPVTAGRKNVPSGGKGPFWASDRQPDQPMRAQFFWFQAAIRVFGFDLGFELWYRCRNAHS